ncbi:MAG: hypothetical protein LBI15_06900 [Dysgonamonadaceae bacterium]|jgi:hypothetical protein|nr:hypothetical protein [Dysgonamonadaceae bacterium]
MKLYKTINAILGISLMLMTACAPIENRETLKNAYEPNNIELTVIHNLPGSNIFTLKMNTPGVIGYWDYNIGRKFSDEVRVIYPIVGKQTFKYIVSSPYIVNGDITNSQLITKEIEVDITFIEEGSIPPHPGAEYLTGDGSKTWVFNVSNPATDLWWYMTDSDPSAFWWQPRPGDDLPSDINGRMVFSRNEDIDSFTYYASPNDTGIGNTRWQANIDWTELRLVGDANILGISYGAVRVPDATPNDGDPLRQVFQILELTENRLVLFQTPMAWSPGWVWVFKPE